MTGDPPISEGDEGYEEVVAYGEKGDPIVKVDGYTVFVDEWRGDKRPDVGDEIAFRVTNAGPDFGFAEEVS
ncbi:MAG: hypothetical protein SVU88_03430 [Candidatus Nanohaloarchaea archaeon]|nr:hypothetical protein [Candidatus Nanohaloarchaea archaeon]